MLQIKTFKPPEQEQAANEFLAANPPTEQGAQFNNDRLYIFFDNGVRSPEEIVQSLLELVRSAEAAKLQQEIAMNTLQYERADLNMVKNKGRYEELSAGIQSCKKGIDLQDSKIAFLMKKIDEVRAQK